MQRYQSGNVLWFVLIGIVLLGTITSLLTRSSSSTNETGNYERESIIASEVLNYLNGIEVAIQHMKARGISEDDISFHGAAAAYTHTPVQPESNRVFSAEGGGITVNDFADASIIDQNSVKNDGEIHFRNGQFDNFGTSARELFATIRNPTVSFCNTINRLAGINGIPTIVGNISDGTFQGDYSANANDRVGDDAGEVDLIDKKFACVLENGGCGSEAGNQCHEIYYILLAR